MILKQHGGEFMKKGICLIVALFCIVFLVACDNGVNEDMEEICCWSCDEMISISSSYCSYCGVNLSESDEVETNNLIEDFVVEDEYVEETPSPNVTNNIQQGSQQNKKTCFSAGCNNIPNNLNSYCSQHACAKRGCMYERTYSSSFCNSHKCDSTGCDNAKNDYGNYCSEHACAESGCYSERSFSSNYCSWHECNELGCKNKKSGIGFYCSEHTCAKSGCTSQKSIMSDYCLMHK